MFSTSDNAQHAPEHVDTQVPPEAVDVPGHGLHPLEQNHPKYDSGSYWQHGSVRQGEPQGVALLNEKPYDNTHDLKQSEQRRDSYRIGGVRPLIFWLLLLCVGLLVVGASVGGAVGGTMATKSSNVNTSSATSTQASTSSASDASSTTASSSTSTSTGLAGIATIQAVALTDCPDSDGSTYNALDRFTSEPGTTRFTKHCGYHVDGNDLVAAYVQSFNLCIDMCSNYNSINATGAAQCTAVEFLADGGIPPSNCWAKTGSNIVQKVGANVALLLPS